MQLETYGAIIVTRRASKNLYKGKKTTRGVHTEKTTYYLVSEDRYFLCTE